MAASYYGVRPDVGVSKCKAKQESCDDGSVQNFSLSSNEVV